MRNFLQIFNATRMFFCAIRIISILYLLFNLNFLILPAKANSLHKQALADAYKLKQVSRIDDGPQGPWKSIGATGPRGPIGATGPRGFTGPVGPQGAGGPQGSVGPAGPIGPMGLVGPNGADGAQGPVGPTGPVGPNGTDGAVGPQGPVGATGATGPARIPQYGYIYNTSAQVVPIEGDITFDADDNLTSGITHTPGNAQITVASAGKYKVAFSVSSVEPNQFTLCINGVPDTKMIYGSGAGAQQNNGQAIITLAAGDVLTLRNHISAAAVTLQTLAGGTQSVENASIIIEQLS